MAKLVPGNAICEVSMINTGWLQPSPLRNWIDIEKSEEVVMPVMSFIIEREGKTYIWDLGLPEDENAVNEQYRKLRGSPLCKTVSPLPSSLSPQQQETLEGIFLSHYHWDHAGDIRTVPSQVPIYLGRGSFEAIRSERRSEFNVFIASLENNIVSRLSDISGSRHVKVDPFEQEGDDVFGDGSFVVVPAPGHCPGHSVAIVRVYAEPESYIILGGDAGHNRALYSACPCHRQLANFSKTNHMHYDESAARKSLEALSVLADREDTWVLVAHEYEAIGVVPERQSLQNWRKQGWKAAIYRRMESERKKGCYVPSSGTS